MKRIILTVLSFLAPFIFIDVIYLASFASFNIHAVFQAGIFWVVSVIYWVGILWLPLAAIWDKEFFN